MEIAKYELCSETSSPTHSADESHHPTLHHGGHHQSSSRGGPRDREREALSQLIMTTPEGITATRTADRTSGNGNNSVSNYHHQQPNSESSSKHHTYSSGGSNDGPSNSNSCHNNFMAQYERNLNFATVALDDGEYGFPKKKTVRDPLSHRIIEKRRRDRMNNCLADLARLLPQASLRKGRGRIEKTEIVELAIRHLQHLQTHPCPLTDNCEYSPLVRKGLIVVSTNHTHPTSSASAPSSPPHGYSAATNPTANAQSKQVHTAAMSSDRNELEFQHGFQECMSETAHFLVDNKGMYPTDGLCLQLVKHLNEHLNLTNGTRKSASDVTDNGCAASIVGMSPCTLELIKNRKTLESSGSNSHDKPCNRPGDDKHSSEKHSLKPSHCYKNTNTTKEMDEDDHDDDHDELDLLRNTSNSTNDQNKNLTISTREADNELMDNNSCSSSTHLSIDLSHNDNGNTPAVATGNTASITNTCCSTSSNSPLPIHNNKNPVIPTIICTDSTSPNNRESPVQIHSFNESLSADEGSSVNSNDATQHRYKFKTTIKQRFNADLQTNDPTTTTPSKCSDYLNPNSNTQSESRNSTSPCNHLRRSNNSSRNSNVSELEEDNNNEVVMKYSSQSGSMMRIKSPVDYSCPEVVVGDPKLAAIPEECCLEKERRKSESPQLPFVSVVKMSTLIESDDESSEQQRHKKKCVNDEYDDTCSKIQLVDSSPINLSTTHSTSMTAAHAHPHGQSDRLGGVSGVPIFALSEKGQYYIPLTLDKSSLETFSSEFEEMESLQISKVPPLYPVTISVCFAQKIRSSQPQPCSKSILLGNEVKYIPSSSSSSKKDVTIVNKLRGNNLNLSVSRTPNMSSPIPNFNTNTCEMERAKQRVIAEFRQKPNVAACPTSKQQPYVVNKYQKNIVESESEPELSITQSYSQMKHNLSNAEESCLRKSHRLPEQQREQQVSCITRADRNSTSVGCSNSNTYSTSNYLYPILLGACTPKTYNNRICGSSSSSSSTRNSNSHQTRTLESTNTNPIRKRCNPSSPSLSPQPHRWREYPTSYPVTTFHPELQRTSVVASDVSDNNSNSRNSSPGTTSANARINNYNLFLESNQLWNCSGRESEQNALNGMLKPSVYHQSIDPRIAGARTSNKCNSNRNVRGGISSPKRQKKDSDDAYSIQNIITLK